MSTSSVSILIPCYNAERWVAHAIQSALNQTHKNREVIVVDDGSTDGSLEVIRTFGDQIRWETGPNRGGNAARNRLLHLSKGAWLQYLDADDYLLPNKVCTQFRISDQHPNADVIYSPALLEEWRHDNAPLPLQEFPLAETSDAWILLARWQLPQTGGTLWRRSSVLQCGGWDESLPCCQEHDLYLRLLSSGAHFLHSPKSEAVYRYWLGPTVSRRNPQQVSFQRLELLRRMQEILEAKGAINAARLRAINTTRFEIARNLWNTDQTAAIDIIRLVHLSEPRFVPAVKTSPWLYTLLYKTLGFNVTEKVASWVRNSSRRIKAKTA